MSKTAQRKKSLYDQGRQDAKTGYYRWKRHRFLADYHRGYIEQSKKMVKLGSRYVDYELLEMEREERQMKRRVRWGIFFNTILYWLGIYKR